METSLIIRIKIAPDFTYFSHPSINSLTGDGFSRTTEGFFEKYLRQMTMIIHCQFAIKTSPELTQLHFQCILAPGAFDQQLPSSTPQI